MNDIDHDYEFKDFGEIKFEDACEYDAVCPHDDEHFKSLNEWRIHHEITHNNDTKGKCPLCSNAWICKLKVRYIDEQYLGNDLRNKKCLKRFKSYDQLLNHIKSKHSNYSIIQV